MELNPDAGGNLMEPDNDDWGWAELLTSPGYTLVLFQFPSNVPGVLLLKVIFQVAGMLCGVLANLLSKHMAPVARIPRDLATRFNLAM